ncbi:hypothetical protein D3C87_1588070 [compost metagenome]
MRVAATGDEIEDRKPFRRVVLLCQHAQPLRYLPCWMMKYVAAVEKDMAACRAVQAGKCGEKRRFSRPVRTEQNGESVRGNVYGYVGKHGRVAIGKLNCLGRKTYVRASIFATVVQDLPRLNEPPPELLMTVVVKYTAFEKPVFTR